MGLIRVKTRGTGAKGRTIAVLLLAVLGCVILILAVRVVNTASHGTKRLELYYRGAKRFGEDEKAAYLKRIAGLWAFDLEFMAGGRYARKTDRLEIKENGIVWQEVEWGITMPADTAETFSQIRTAFINPYGIVRGDTLSDAYILTQAFINGHDTCFGGYNLSELWQISRKGENLLVSRRNYRPYRGDPAGFFGRGSVKFIENAGKQLFYDTVVQGVRETKLNNVNCVRKTDAETGRLVLFPIRDTLTTLDGYFRARLENTYRFAKGASADAGSLKELLERYYQPFIVSERWRLFPRQLPSEVPVAFTVTADGRTSDVALTDPSGYGRMLIEDISGQISSWRFPSSRVPLKIKYTFYMP